MSKCNANIDVVRDFQDIPTEMNARMIHNETYPVRNIAIQHTLEEY